MLTWVWSMNTKSKQRSEHSRNLDKIRSRGAQLLSKEPTQQHNRTSESKRVGSPPIANCQRGSNLMTRGGFRSNITICPAILLKLEGSQG